MPRPKSKNPGDAAWRRRTREMYPIKGQLCVCGKPAEVRHHRDGNVRNLARRNIQFLCRACHVEQDPKIIPH